MNNNLVECLEQFDVELLGKYIRKYHRPYYNNWLCLSYQNKVIELCRLILRTPNAPKDLRIKANETLKHLGSSHCI